MNIHLVLNIKRNTVVEHIAHKLLVRLARHKHKSIVRRFPTRKDNDSPVTVLGVYVVEIGVGRAFGANNFLCDCLQVGAVARQHDNVGYVFHRFAVFVLEVTHFVCKGVERLFKRRRIFANFRAVEIVTLGLALKLFLRVGVRTAEKREPVARRQIHLCFVESALFLSTVCKSPRTEFGFGLVICAYKPFGFGLHIRTHTRRFRVVRHFFRDGKLFHKGDMFNRLFETEFKRIVFRTLPLFRGLERVEIRLRKHRFRIAAGFFYVKQHVE